MNKLATKKQSKETDLAVSGTIDRWLTDVLEGRRSSLFPSMQFDWEPQVDIIENDKEIILSASLPGVAKNDISVEVSDHTLSIRGERKEESEEKTKGYIRREQSYGSFYRSFALPENIKSGDIKAIDNNGLLEIHLPKAKTGQAETVKKVNVE
jgi:HSP20 family protein